MTLVIKTLLVIRKPPFGSMDSWEGMRLALSFYAAGTSVDILLEGAGVFNWISGISRVTKDPRSVSRFVKDLEQFEIPVYLASEDLDEQGVALSDLASTYPKLIRRSEIAQLIASHDSVIAL